MELIDHKYLEILKQYWGYDNFRPLQGQIITSIGSGKDTLALMPTGGGKSITFQVPALAQPGLCLVITPLIALMKDQVANLKSREIKAAAIYSGMSRDHIRTVIDNCTFGDFKFLYISPERIDTAVFKQYVENLNISLIAVDESHCISQWGYDFRPSYLKIANIREMLPQVPIIALTASATPSVVIDIMKKLQFKTPNVIRAGFKRSNLGYVVRQTEDKNRYLLNILQKMPGCAIVYVRSRKKTKEIAQFLIENNITAGYYHAGINADQKDLCQKQWMDGEIRVIVATNAFGMGIDKPDVRIVVHIDVPDSVEAYFQEAGRAGRDGLTAWAVMIYNATDKTRLNKTINDTYPEKEYIKTVYDSLCNYLQLAVDTGEGRIFDFDITLFCIAFKLSITRCHSAIKILENGEYLTLTDEQENASFLHFIADKHELYNYQSVYHNGAAIIQMLLRTYSGLFTEYIRINEKEIAKKTDLSHDDIYTFLVQLSKIGLAKYIPRKKSPLIIFRTNRIASGSLKISKTIYEDLRERHIARIDAVLSYAEKPTVCRSKQLLHYFGEEEKEDCGLCDVCRDNAKIKDEERLRQLKIDRILEVLKANPMTIVELTDKLAPNKKEFVQLVRLMLDSGYLTLDHTGKLITK